MYLPKSWAVDEERRAVAKIPKALPFQTKPEIALQMLQDALERGAPKRPVLADAAYGDDRSFRESIRAMGLHYVVGISSNTTVWPPGSMPRQPMLTGRRGRPRTRDRDNAGLSPIRVGILAEQLWQQGRFRSLTWRKGTKGNLQGSFCAVRIRSAERRTKGSRPSEPLWLLLQRDSSQKTGFRYALSSLKKSTSLKKLVFTAKLRWRIERDYQDMKQHLGFDQYEGRQWGGFHRHLAMVALVHAFLALYREDFSPGVAEAPVDVGGLLQSAHRGRHALGRSLSAMPTSV